MSKVCENFDKMYKKKAYLHWYTMEGLDQNEFSEAEAQLSYLLNEYETYSETDETEVIDPVKATSTQSSARTMTEGKGFVPHYLNKQSPDKVMDTSSEEDSDEAGEYLVAPRDPNTKTHLAAGKTVMPSLNEIKTKVLLSPEVQRRNSASLRNLLSITEKSRLKIQSQVQIF